MFEYRKIALHELYPTALVTRPYVKPLRSHAHLNLPHRNYKNEASGGSAEPICTVKASVDSPFSELPSAIFSVSVLLARAEIFSIYWRSDIATVICQGLLDV